MSTHLAESNVERLHDDGVAGDERRGLEVRQHRRADALQEEPLVMAITRGLNSRTAAAIAGIAA